MKTHRHRRWCAGTFAFVLATTTAVAVAPSANAQAAGCDVTYTVANQWPGGFTANVTVENLGAPLDGWELTWSFDAGQTVDHLWNGSYSQTGSEVAVTDAGWNGALDTGASASFGFNGTSNGTDNPAPSNVALNGATCTGEDPPPTSPTPTPTTSPPPPTSPPPGGTLPDSFEWSSSGELVSPKNDARDLAAIKDPSVVRHNGEYHMFATTASSDGYHMVYSSFSDWSQADSATHHYLDQSAIGTGYRAAPQIFYFAPQDLWYLVYQDGNAAYSTNPDISDPDGWSAPQHFYDSMPAIIEQNIGDGYWVDMWVICDEADCYLFSSDDNGHLYRSETTRSQFPNGFGNTTIALEEPDAYDLFEASNIYSVQGSDEYLLIVEAIGSDGRRWFRSWTGDSIDGSWDPLAASESNPFARSNNVSFDGPRWTEDISHGEMLRAGNDQTLPVSPCDMRYVYQGLDPDAEGEYDSVPWRLGLLTQTNSAC